MVYLTKGGKMYRLTIEMSPTELEQAQDTFDTLMVGHTIIIKDGYTSTTFNDIVAIKDPQSKLIVTSTGKILPLSKMHLVVKITGHTLEIPITAFCNEVIRNLYPQLKLPTEHLKTIVYLLVPDAKVSKLKKVTFDEVSFGDEILDPTVMGGSVGIVAFIDRTSGFFATADNRHFGRNSCSHLLFTGRRNLPFYANDALQHFLSQNYPE